VDPLLRCFGAAQIAIGLLNFALPRLLSWRPALAAMPLLLRQVFHVHVFFLALTLFIFGGLTLAYGRELGPLGPCIGLFWLARVGAQLFYYSPSHWRGRLGPHGGFLRQTLVA
jgi:hypothetical protein